MADRVARIWVLLVAVVAGGCSLTPPAPWEKDLLAKPAMAMGTESAARRRGEQVHEARENSFGGAGVSAGGCGCN